jgi:hypothetical protein
MTIRPVIKVVDGEKVELKKYTCNRCGRFELIENGYIPEGWGLARLSPIHQPDLCDKCCRECIEWMGSAVRV